MAKFVKGDQISQQSMSQYIQPSKDIELEIPEEVEKEEEQLDKNELQNYLTVIGKWRPEQVLEFDKDIVDESIKSLGLNLPSYSDIYNNAKLGDIILDVTQKHFSKDLQEK